MVSSKRGTLEDMAIIGIVAVDRNGAIGKQGGLPWHYSADMKFFRQQTTGHACVMGYRTWRSLKKPLKDRLNIVLSRNSEVEPQPGVVVVRDTVSVLSLKEYLSCDLFVIGGEQVYRSFLPHVDKWLVTEIPLAVEGTDTFMPGDYLQGFKPSGSQQLEENLRVMSYERTVDSSQ
jgi:dihydrofolate reductase